MSSNSKLCGSPQGGRRARLVGALLVLGVFAACGGGGSDGGAAGTGGGGGTGTSVTLSCDTSKFVAGAAVAAPTVADLATFAASYTGQEGDFNLSGTFVGSGAAVLVLSAGGVVSYNGATQTVVSACVESFGGGSKQLVLHFPKLAGNPIEPHVDLAPGAGGLMTGASPVSLKTVQGARP